MQVSSVNPTFQTKATTGKLAYRQQPRPVQPHFQAQGQPKKEPGKVALFFAEMGLITRKQRERMIPELKAATPTPKVAKVLVQLYMAHAQGLPADKAMPWLNKALETATTHASLIRQDMGERPANLQKARILHQVGRASHETGDIDRAYTTLAEALNLYRTNATARHEKYDYVGVMRTLKNILVDKENDGPTFGNMATSLLTHINQLLRDEPEDDSSPLNPTLIFNPDAYIPSPEVMYNLGGSHFVINGLREEVEAMKRDLENSPKWGDRYFPA